MLNLIRSLMREPLLTGAVTFCLLVVGGLVLSDWAEKRRARNLLKARDALRELHLRSRFQGDSTPDGDGKSPGANARRALFGWFRWKFALFSAVAVAFVLPRMQDDLKVEAQSSADTAPAPIQTASTREASAPASAPIQADAFAEDVGSTFLGNVGLSLSGAPQINSDSLALSTGAGTVDCAALFQFSNTEMEMDFLAESSDGEFRKNYPVQLGSMPSMETQRSGRFGRR